MDTRRTAILALLLFLPVLAHADVRSHSKAAETISYRGVEASMAWRCKSTGIDGFDQCALLVNGKVVTWRMAPTGEELIARVNANGALEIERVQLVSHSSRKTP
jgi:hypothetical protein